MGVRESAHQTSLETEHRKGEEKKKTDFECGLHQTKSQTSVGHLVLGYLICKERKIHETFFLTNRATTSIFLLLKKVHGDFISKNQQTLQRMQQKAYSSLQMEEVSWMDDG